MKSPKKRVFKDGDTVHCVACRYVVSCGYEHTFLTCLKELALEAGMSERDIQLSGVRLKEDLFNHNPKFKESRENLREAIYKVQNAAGMTDSLFDIGEINVYDDGDTYNYTVRKLVSAMVRSRLRGYIKEGNERKLFFKELNPSVGRRFPQIVIKGTRRVVTGTYYSGHYSQDHDGEVDVFPAGLTNTKQHLLLEIDQYDYRNRADLPVREFNQEREISLLADDCVHDDDLKMTDKLMEEPMAARA